VLLLELLFLVVHIDDADSDLLFCYTNTPTPLTYALSLHDALPISAMSVHASWVASSLGTGVVWKWSNTHSDSHGPRSAACARSRDRKSTRLNSSHVKISYAVFCLKKKKQTQQLQTATCE